MTEILYLAPEWNQLLGKELTVHKISAKCVKCDKSC